MNKLLRKLSGCYNILKFKMSGAQIGKKFRVIGSIGLLNKGNIKIGDNFRFSSGDMSNPMGRNVRGFISVSKNAALTIGNNTGISSGCLRVSQGVSIGNNVKVGALTIITDTDAHSLDPILRANPETDSINAKSKPIVIKDNVLIGTSCIVCKGVTIGENSVIGAGSVVTRDIPDNVIAAGNPCRTIRSL